MERIRKFGFVVAICLLISAVALAQTDVFVRDILENPQRYYNLTVRIQGEVVDVQMPLSAGDRGFFVLLDNSDKKIKVVSNTLPAPQTTITLTGVVQIQTEDQEPFIRETSRTEGLAGGPCKDGDVRTVICKNGKTVVVARCVNGEWVPTGDGCAKPIPWAIIVLAGLIMLIIAALLILIFKKPKAKEAAAMPQIRVSPTGQSASGSGTAAVPAPGPERTRQVSVSEIERAVGGMKTKQVPSLLAEVRVLTGSQSGKGFPLGFETVIGRVRGDIILEDASVSREHAKILFLGNRYAIENLSETNPVILNGEKVQAQKELKTGDEIVCGVIKLQFRLI